MTLKGNQIGQDLQFDGQNSTRRVEIGRVWFSADFFYISGSPAPGNGGPYAGQQVEKIVISDVPLITSSPVSY